MLLRLLKMNEEHLKEQVFSSILKSLTCDALDLKDHFFDSLRNDYIEFNNWFKIKCLREHRPCFVIWGNEGDILGLCIYKRESPMYEMDGLVIKMCTFKSDSKGNKHGELLLHRMLQTCYELNADWLYVTAYQENKVCLFLEDFGFECYERRKEDTGEKIYRKKLKPSIGDEGKLSPFDYHKKYGFRYFNKKEEAFFIPLDENRYNFLFPETSDKNVDALEFLNAESNAIRKKVRFTDNIKAIRKGSILLFCKSKPSKIIRCCGIVENVFHSSKRDELKEYVGREPKTLQVKFGNDKDWLCIQFRQTENFEKNFYLDELIEKNLIKRYPTRITKISDEVKDCILKNMPY